MKTIFVLSLLILSALAEAKTFAENMDYLRTFSIKYLPEREVGETVESAKNMDELKQIVDLVNDNVYSHGYTVFPQAYIKRLRDFGLSESAILTETKKLNPLIQTNVLTDLATEKRTPKDLTAFINEVNSSKFYNTDTTSEFYRRTSTQMMNKNPSYAEITDWLKINPDVGGNVSISAYEGMAARRFSFAEALAISDSVAKNTTARIVMLGRAIHSAENAEEFDAVVKRMVPLGSMKLGAYESEDLRLVYRQLKAKSETLGLASSHIPVELSGARNCRGGVAGYLRQLKNQFSM